MNTPITPYVVSFVAKDNWCVTTNNNASVDGFKNWAKAVKFARAQANLVGAIVIRLAKDGCVVEVLEPQY